jgi:hypothetical protein
MHTRAALIGARLKIGRAGGKGGTRVTIEIAREQVEAEPSSSQGSAVRVLEGR